MADSNAVEVAVEKAIAEGAQVVSAAILGHKADLCILALAPDFWVLRRLQRGVAAAGFEIVHSYLSLTEVSEYATTVPDKMKQARLHPQLPPEGMNAFCFYPMSKRRNGDANWYRLPYEERKELMFEHGKVGRTYHGRIVQLVTGSTGIDDWEWGVTLFGTAPDDLKDCVYHMRFDEASALYAEFGPFYTGMVAPLHDVLEEIGNG
jgi:chlorite dismutase